MNMKVVVLRIFVEDCPFLGVAQLHSYVGPVLIKDLVVNKKRCFCGFTENANVRRCAIGLDRTMSTYSGPIQW
jgi:hypothetical protein